MDTLNDIGETLLPVSHLDAITAQFDLSNVILINFANIVRIPFIFALLALKQLLDVYKEIYNIFIPSVYHMN